MEIVPGFLAEFSFQWNAHNKLDVTASLRQYTNLQFVNMFSIIEILAAFIGFENLKLAVLKLVNAPEICIARN